MPEGFNTPARQTANVTLVFVFSLFSSLLALATPLFALQVFDRVLSSQSLETLGTLCVVLALVLAAAGVLDHARKRLLARIVQDWAAGRLDHAIAADLRQQNSKARLAAELLQRLSSARAISALTDLPWTALFLLALYLMHPALALLGCAGLCLLLVDAGLAWRGSGLPEQPERSDIPLSERVLAHAGQAFRRAESQRLRGRWAQATHMEDGDAARRETVLSVRALLQSGVIALGAALVIGGHISPGMIVAAAFLMARLLAPLEAVTQNQTLVRQAWQAVRLLRNLPKPGPEPLAEATTPGELRVSGLTLALPGGRALSDVNFLAGSGALLGVTGAPGSGKSALALAICGALPPRSGHVERRGHARDARLLRQDCEAGQGLARDLVTAERPDPGGRLADEALRLAVSGDPAGPVPVLLADASSANRMERRQICLARVIFGSPGLVVLDEPERDLTASGLAALQKAIEVLRQRGTIVVVISQRPALLRGCDQLVVLEGGRQITSGPPSDVLAFPAPKKAVAL